MPAAPAGPGPGAPPAVPPARGFFPYPITRETLPNGLTLLVVPFDSPGVASFYTLVRAGSRNEVEPGRSGFAHFFEHMMFRGTQKWPEGARRALLAETGSDDNGWTTDDYTCYALTTQSARLDGMIAEEADRIRNLRYSEPAFRTESRAVLGEYNKDIANPEEKLDETLRATAFTAHTYRHTTMGFVEDIRAMPEGYDYSRSFFDRYYVPAEVVLIASGDVDPAGVAALVRKHYGSWKKAGTVPKIAPEPAQTAERRATIAWEAPTLPRLAIAWHAPAATDLRAAAALRLLVPSLFGPTSDLYRDLVLDRRLAVALSAQYDLTRDPGLFTVTVRATKAEDLPVIERSVTTVLEGLGPALSSRRTRSSGRASGSVPSSCSPCSPPRGSRARSPPGPP